MSAQTASPSHYPTIREFILGWERWLRLGQTVRGAPFAAATAVGAGILMAIVSRLRPWLQAADIAILTAVLMLAGLALMILIVWLRPRPLIVSARRFDRLFQLQERTSTALELLSGSIPTSDEFMRHQLDDALRCASAVKPREQLPLRLDGRAWALPALLTAVLALLLWLPNPQSESIAAESARQAAIAEAEDALRDIFRDIAADPELNDTDRSQLLEALQSAIDILDQPNVTPEEALAAISSAETTLNQTGQRLQQQASAAQSGLENAAAAMQSSLPSLQEQTQAGSNAPAELVERLGAQLDTLNPSEQQQAAQALDSAAQSLQTTAPSLAETLRDAADSLEQGRTQTAQAQLQQAQQQAAQTAQQIQQAQNSAEQIEQAAQRAQQTRAQTSQANDQNADQSGQQPGDSASQGQQGESSAQSGQPQAGGEAESAQAGQQQGAQQSQDTSSGAAGQQGEQGGQAEAQSGQQQSAGDPSQGSAAAGSGDAESQTSSQTLGLAGQQPDQGNNPDGSGERAFEPIYAPVRLGGEAQGEQIQLEPDTSDMPVLEGEFAQNPTGRAVVPYNQVFGDYAAAANRALESDYVPLGLRDVVRNYFSGLEPRRSGR